MGKRLLFKRDVIRGLLDYAKELHPQECILLLRGQVKRDSIVIEGLVIPPFATHTQSFSAFPTYMLPLDLSLMGVAHSHPSGSKLPSQEDLLNAWGRIMVIIGYPYESEEDIKAFDKEGNLVPYIIID